MKSVLKTIAVLLAVCMGVSPAQPVAAGSATVTVDCEALSFTVTFTTKGAGNGGSAMIGINNMVHDLGAVPAGTHSTSNTLAYGATLIHVYVDGAQVYSETTTCEGPSPAPAGSATVTVDCEALTYTVNYTTNGRGVTISHNAFGIVLTPPAGTGSLSNPIGYGNNAILVVVDGVDVYNETTTCVEPAPAPAPAGSATVAVDCEALTYTVNYTTNGGGVSIDLNNSAYSFTPPAGTTSSVSKPVGYGSNTIVVAVDGAEVYNKTTTCAEPPQSLNPLPPPGLSPEPIAGRSSVVPERLLDSRGDGVTVDGEFRGGGVFGVGESRRLRVAGRGGVPVGVAGSVVLNVTVTEPSAASFLTVFPAGVKRPNASNLNFVAGQTVPNMVIVPVGADGDIEIYNHAGQAHVIVDVLEFYPESVYKGLTPARLMDTRSTGETVDKKQQGKGVSTAGSSRRLSVVGRGGVPVGASGSVALNVTVTEPNAPSFLTVFPAGVKRPDASNLNFVAGQTVPNMVVVPIGADGSVDVYNHGGSTHVLVDVLGYFPSGKYAGVTPARLLDTRPTGKTVDAKAQGGGVVKAGQPVELQVAGRNGLDANATGSVALNVTVTQPTAASFLTVYPAGEKRPNASNLNVLAGDTRPNMVIVPIGKDGKISIYNHTGDAHVIVDILGHLPKS